MADVLVNQDFKGAARVVNLPEPAAAQEPATKNYVDTGRIKGVSGFCAGKPAASEVVLSAVSPYAFTITQANCAAKSLVAAAASAVFQVKKNGTNVCTLTFSAAGLIAAVGTVTAGAVAIGDVVTVTGPASADATLADIAFLIRE